MKKSQKSPNSAVPAAAPIAKPTPFTMDEVRLVIQLASTAPLQQGLPQAQAVSLLLGRFQQWASTQLAVKSDAPPAT